MANVLTRPTTECRYFAQVWATDRLREAAVENIQRMVYALLPTGFAVTITQEEHEQPGYPHAPPYRYRAFIGGEGERTKWMTSAQTHEGAWAAILTLLVDRSPVYPLTSVGGES